MFVLDRFPKAAHVTHIQHDFCALYEDIRPLLYTGLNSEFVRVLGLVVDDADERELAIEMLVPLPLILLFFTSQISYRALIERVGQVFFVERDYRRHSICARRVHLADIPNTYLPDPKYFLDLGKMAYM